MNNKNDKLIVKIDITDWRDEAHRSEEMITNEEDIYKALVDGKTSGEVARLTVVSREEQIAPSDIIRPNKLLYYTGVLVDISAIAKHKHREVMVESGKTYEVSELIGYPGKDSESEAGGEFHKSYVTMDSPKAVEYHKRYLEKVIPGNIWKRLLSLHECGQDVEEAADELIGKIEEMVQRITEPKP